MSAPSVDRTTVYTGGLTRPEVQANISRVPYLPGLDGIRALAVVSVMIYHANSDWLKGGFLGVEVFFVISGYLITLLLISEKEQTNHVDMKHFWIRRARRLLPALFVMLFMLTIWTALFERSTLGKLRGDVVAALTYGSNWYQVYTGQGYSAANDFAPLRHLWSLAVEEQFYLIWPIVMAVLLRMGSRRVADLSRWLFGIAVAITILLAVLYHQGPIGTPDVTPGAYWHIFGRNIAKADFLYLSTFSRAGGLLLGSAFAMIWRPLALMRGPLRTRGRDARRHRHRRPRDVGVADVVGRIRRLPWRRPAVVPRRILRHGDRHPCRDRRGHPSADAHRSRALSVPVLVWIGAALVRPVPLSLARVPADAPHRRPAHEVPRVPDRDGDHARHHRALVPLHRDPDPQGRTLQVVGQGARRRATRAVATPCWPARSWARRSPSSASPASPPPS